MILDSIEKSIKEKIEKLGTPLSEWDIKINRGILTGFNEAFIISGIKREELISKDPKSAEIIRPILRGRDIKRYSYQYADLNLICTFPSRRYDIENYPAVKRHLLNFGYERLEQSGKLYVINGEKITSRKKTNNKWFETQDSISYWEDFNKQNIVWSDIAKEPSFVWLPENILFNNTIYMIVGLEKKDLAVLNSSLIKWYFPTISSSLGGGNRYFKEFVQRIPLPKNTSVENELELDRLVRSINKNGINSDLDNQIDDIVFSIFGLSNKENNIIFNSC